MKSQALAEAMSRSIAAGAPQPAGIWAQVGQLSADAEALQAAAEAAEREAIPNSDPSFLAAIELSLRCPDWPGASPPAAAARGPPPASLRSAARGEQAPPQMQSPPQAQAAPQMLQAPPQMQAPPQAQVTPQLPWAAAPQAAFQQLATTAGEGAVAEAPPAGLETPQPAGLKHPRGTAFAQSLASLQECEDMCNYEGICRESVCYCHAGYTGEACEIKKHSQRGTMPMEWAVVIILVVGLVFYLSGLGFMSITSKMGKEETGDYYHAQA